MASIFWLLKRIFCLILRNEVTGINKIENLKTLFKNSQLDDEFFASKFE